MKSLRNYLISSALLIGILSFYIPIRYNISYPRDIGPQFDNHVRQTYINFLNQEQPEIFMLGDSMLGSDVEESIVDEKLQRKVKVISLPGTASTIWYLIIKNNIVLAEHKPKYLVVSFRDSMMTVPGFRTTGRYFELIDEFATPADTLLIERAYINQMTPLEKFMEARMPLFGSRWTIRQSIDYYVRYLLGSMLLDCDTTCMDQAMESTFENSNLDLTFLSQAINAADDYFYTDKTLDFDEQIDKSLLPEIIRLCKENNIQLILVRMPTLRFTTSGTKPSGLDDYIQNLGGFLEENNVFFLDFDQKKDMPAEYFSDTLHLNEQGKLIFTDELSEALDTIIR